MTWPPSNGASHDNQAARADIRHLQLERQKKALELELARWPYRAVEAGVAAKLARRFGHWAGRVLSGDGSLSW